MKRVAIGLLVASLLVCGCTKSGQTVAPDKLTVALPINPQQLNGILTQDSSENFSDSLIYSLLVTIDDKGNQVPDLAETVPTLQNGGISKDELTITYHLRKHVRWHDGAPFTSKDVKYTWQQIMNPANNVVSRHGFDQVRSVDTPDDFTVVFHMKRVFPPAVDTIFGESDTVLRVLPEHLLAKYPNLNQIPFNSAPVGTGPYKFVRWQRGDRIELAANEQYYKGAPSITSLTLKPILDTNTTQAQLRSHEAQLAVTMTAPTYNELANAGGITRQLVKAPFYEAIFFNVTRPPLDDVRVRRAIALAIDREQLMRVNTYGTAQLAVADLSPFYKEFDSSLKPLPYDPAQAKQLLDSAGWTRGPGRHPEEKRRAPVAAIHFRARQRRRSKPLCAGSADVESRRHRRASEVLRLCNALCRRSQRRNFKHRQVRHDALCVGARSRSRQLLELAVFDDSAGWKQCDPVLF